MVSGPDVAPRRRARWLLRWLMFVAAISLGLMLGISSAAADDGSGETGDDAGALGKALRDVKETTERTAEDGADAAGKARESAQQAAAQAKPDRPSKAAANRGKRQADGQAQQPKVRNAAEDKADSHTAEKRLDVAKQATKTARDVTRRAAPERPSTAEKGADVRPEVDQSKEVDHGRAGDSDDEPEPKQQRAQRDVRTETEKVTKVAKQVEESARTTVQAATSDQDSTDGARSTPQSADRSATAPQDDHATQEGSDERSEKRPEVKKAQAAQASSEKSRPEEPRPDTEVADLRAATERSVEGVSESAAEQLGQVAKTAEGVKEPAVEQVVEAAAPAAHHARELDRAVVQPAMEASVGDILDRTPVAPLVESGPVEAVLTETSVGGALERSPLKGVTEQLSIADVVDRTPVAELAEVTRLAPILEPVLQQVDTRAVEDGVTELVDHSLATTPQQILDTSLESVADQLPGGGVTDEVRDLDVGGLAPGSDLWRAVVPVTETVGDADGGERSVSVHDQLLPSVPRTVSETAALPAQSSSERTASTTAPAVTPAELLSTTLAAPTVLDLASWQSEGSPNQADQQAGVGSEPVADAVDAADGSNDMNGSTPWSGPVPGGDVVMAPSGSAQLAVALAPWADHDFATDEVAISSFEELPTSAPQEPGFAPD